MICLSHGPSHLQSLEHPVGRYMPRLFYFWFSCIVSKLDVRTTPPLRVESALCVFENPFQLIIATKDPQWGSQGHPYNPRMQTLSVWFLCSVSRHPTSNHALRLREFIWIFWSRSWCNGPCPAPLCRIRKFSPIFALDAKALGQCPCAQTRQCCMRFIPRVPVQPPAC